MGNSLAPTLELGLGTLNEGHQVEALAQEQAWGREGWFQASEAPDLVQSPTSFWVLA